MGGAADKTFSDFNRSIESIPVIGKATSNALNYANPAGLAINAVKATDRSIQGVKTMQNAPRDAANAAAATAKTQNDLAASAEAKLALQPKKVASDDFLANKNRMLQNMRLGLMSSVGGNAGAASPSLSAPSLTGKSKLGA